MPAAQDFKTRAAPPPAPSEQRAWARRANAVLVEQELPGQDVPGDTRLELRWVMVEAVPPKGERPGKPAHGEWHVRYRAGLQTARDFGVPRRPLPVRLGKGNTPQDACRKAQRYLDKGRIRTMNDGTRFALSHHLKTALERLRDLDREERQTKRMNDRRQERLAWHRARAQQAGPAAVSAPVVDAVSLAAPAGKR